jgi:hypothetical protein
MLLLAGEPLSSVDIWLHWRGRRLFRGWGAAVVRKGIESYAFTCK